MLRMILHGWPAEIAINILKNQLPALRANYPRSRLLVMDTVLPTPGSDSTSIVDEALLRVRDLTMMQTFNSKSGLHGYVRTCKYWYHRHDTILPKSYAELRVRCKRPPEITIRTERPPQRQTPPR